MDDPSLEPTAPTTSERRRRFAARLAPVLGLLALGALAGAGAMVLQPAVTGAVGPGSVSIEPSLARGDTVVDLPPLGRVRADTHRGPIGVQARVERIDLGAAGIVVRDEDPAAALVGQIEDDLRPLLRDFVVRTLLVAVVAGAAVGLVLPRRRVAAIAATTTGSVAFVAFAGVAAFVTFQPTSFDSPEFEGALSAAPDIVATVQRHIDDVEVVESRIESLADRVVDLYQTVEGDPRTGDDVDLVVLHVSDLHSNPVGIELVEQTAERFEVDAILDTGDLTSFGASVERAVVRRIARIDLPYYLVPGNHDSFAMRDQLARAGVTILDGEVIELGGVRILGVEDPTFTADNVLTRDERADALARAARSLRRLTERERPDVVMVHNVAQAAEIHGLAEVVLAGHVHEPDIAYEGGTALVEAGSAGATGVGALMEDDDLPYEMQLLQFEGDRLVAVDRIAFTGTDGAFRLERVLIDPDRVLGYPNRDRARDLLAPFRDRFQPR